MARNIQLNSSDWCDIVFTGKNKTYGAYALRQSSSKRHLLAFFIVVIFVGIVAGLPSILNAVNPPKEYVQNITSEYIVGGADELEKEEEPIVEPSTTPPPPPIIDSQKFTPPVVTADDMVEESRELLSQQELNSSTAQISIATMETGNTEGVDIEEVLKEQRQITNQPPQEPNQIHEIVEIMPQFPGGTSELMRYLSANMKYPTIAAENNIEGRVVLKFVVGKDGSISNIQVIRPLDPSCDKEAVRVVRSMSKWIPGMQNGHPVAVYFTLPVLFKLQR
ncbi:energy transducer TonB [Dysgonomonas sp. HGC4]|uniref:energy transducer TonB n=1 Tax=Dysgonomonas sp. HGC4 TaxID=1658009 RepID=UPI0009E27F00|nr:energy transducer TonB [Dysgonomonas sp. HGC4]MBD8348334.1 energy transducer TonB [Dysgonomonas sp. HGC4]